MELKPDISELIGAIIGDGNVYYKKNCWVEITGHITEDKAYFENRISGIIKNSVGCIPSIYFRKEDNSIRLRIFRKAFVMYWKSLGLPTGKGKSLVITIPKVIANNWELARACLRGLYDTDGSVYFDYRISYLKAYPRIDLHLGNKALIMQVAAILLTAGFRPKVVISKKSVYLNGLGQLKLFLEKIGFSNDKHLLRIKHIYPNILYLNCNSPR